MTGHIPDLDSYWRHVDEELDAQPARTVLEAIPRHSTPDFTVHALRITSIGPYRISGYLSIPAGDGPFPALLEVPGYGSVTGIPHWNDRLRYVVLTVIHRGQRLADQPFAASYPGLLTRDIEDPARYVYRGIVADCLRSAELLASRPEVDPERVAVVGGDLAVVTAALRPRFAAVAVTPGMLYRAMELRARSEEYPIEELNDHLRARPGSEAAVAGTLSLFDPVRHAPGVEAPTLVSVGSDGAADGRPWLDPLLEALGGPVEQHHLTYRGRIDADAQDAWLAGRLGVGAMSRFQAGAS